MPSAYPRMNSRRRDARPSCRHRANVVATGHSPGSRRKREENCSLPLMTSGNNISEVRRGRTSRCRGGRLERADLTAGCRQPDVVSDLETFTAVCIYPPRMMPRLKHCEGIVARERYIPFLSARPVVSLPVASTHPWGSLSRNGFSGFERSTAANAESRPARASKLNVGSAIFDLYRVYRRSRALSRADTGETGISEWILH